MKKKGGQKRLTPASFAEAIRVLTVDDIKDCCTPPGITRAAMEKMRAGDSEDVAVTKAPPSQTQVARMPPTSAAAGAYEQARHDLREIGVAKKETCAPLKERCERSRDHVLTHLRAHDPQKMEQQVRMSQGKEDRTYVLKARPKPARPSRVDTVREAESTIAAALGGKAMPAAEALAHLQSEGTIAFVDEQLQQRLQKLKQDAVRKAPLDVTFAPAKPQRPASNCPFFLPLCPKEDGDLAHGTAADQERARGALQHGQPSPAAAFEDARRPR